MSEQSKSKRKRRPKIAPLEIESCGNENGGCKWYSRGHHDLGSFLKALLEFYGEEIGHVSTPDETPTTDDIYQEWWRAIPLGPGSEYYFDYGTGGYYYDTTRPDSRGAFRVTCYGEW